MKNIILFWLFGLFFLTEIYSQDLVKPNVIIFYADDLGWQDTPLNDVGDLVPWETPNMLSLAAEGAKFSQAYSPAPTCAPSRGALLTGRHPVKTKLIQVSGGDLPGSGNISDEKILGTYNPRRLDVNETTIAEALSPAGYVSSHIGKWHIAGPNGFPEAIHQGFGSQSTSRGMHRNMGDRWINYATDDPTDEFQIDADGRPFDSLTEDALTFMEENKSEPFFMYMATYLVHTPIQTRDLALLSYYCEKLGIEVPTEDTDITTGGHSNPYYGAMVGTLDWSLGRVVDYLKATDDPRNPGKKLFETTYILFSSDNGASEMDGDEIVTDNFPLDLGKTSAKEGGIRVPLVITGPDIPVNEFDNVVNGLDFFPTILSLTGTTIADDLADDFDGVDLTPLLKGESTIVTDVNGNERTDLFWHYPNANDDKSKSAIRCGNYKLYKKYIDGSYEAFQLYNDDGSFNDIEEFINVIDNMPVSTKDELITKLETFLTDNNAEYPTWNPDYTGPDAPLPHQELVPSVASVSYNQDNNIATATITENPGEAKIAVATLLYKENTTAEDDEWFELEETTINGNIITAEVPINATAIVFNMIDENNFLVLSEEWDQLKIPEIVLNTVDAEQKFEPESENVYTELLGGATVNAAYIQMTTEGGGDGYTTNVRSITGKSVECKKISFRVRSREGDVARFNVTIDDKTHSFEYTSTRDADDVIYEFDTPILFTDKAQPMEFIITGLTNSDSGTTPRFRNYDVTFHLDLTTVGLENLENNVNDIIVFPNPVNGTFSLSEPVKTGVLYNIDGSKAFEFTDQYKDIDMSNFNTGLYILQVTLNDGSEQILKLLKN